MCTVTLCRTHGFRNIVDTIQHTSLPTCQTHVIPMQSVSSRINNRVNMAGKPTYIHSSQYAWHAGNHLNNVWCDCGTSLHGAALGSSPQSLTSFCRPPLSEFSSVSSFGCTWNGTSGNCTASSSICSELEADLPQDAGHRADDPWPARCHSCHQHGAIPMLSCWPAASR